MFDKTKKLRKISAEELSRILEQHQKYLDYEYMEDEEKGAIKADLSYTDLSGLNLSKVDLRDANLEGADLSNANLSEANLSPVFCRNANLQNTNLKNVLANEADFEESDLSNANLKNADLTTANLAYANCSNANLECANLRYADLRETNFTNANLENVDLRNRDRGWGDELPCLNTNKLSGSIMDEDVKEYIGLSENEIKIENNLNNILEKLSQERKDEYLNEGITKEDLRNRLKEGWTTKDIMRGFKVITGIKKRSFKEEFADLCKAHNISPKEAIKTMVNMLNEKNKQNEAQR